MPFLFISSPNVKAFNTVHYIKEVDAVKIEIMRAFVKLRQMRASNKELAKRLNELEERYDARSRSFFEAIRELMTPPEPKRRSIGFKRGKEMAKNVTRLKSPDMFMFHRSAQSIKFSYLFSSQSTKQTSGRLME